MDVYGVVLKKIADKSVMARRLPVLFFSPAALEGWITCWVVQDGSRILVVDVVYHFFGLRASSCTFAFLFVGARSPPRGYCVEWWVWDSGRRLLARALAEGECCWSPSPCSCELLPLPVIA